MYSNFGNVQPIHFRFSKVSDLPPNVWLLRNYSTMLKSVKCFKKYWSHFLCSHNFQDMIGICLRFETICVFQEFFKIFYKKKNLLCFKECKRFLLPNVDGCQLFQFSQMKYRRHLISNSDNGVSIWRVARKHATSKMRNNPQTLIWRRKNLQSSEDA